MSTNMFGLRPKYLIIVNTKIHSISSPKKIFEI
jgi:hypothetical protein